MDAWIFIAYKSNKHYERKEFYYDKIFLDFNEMKVFSSKHSVQEKLFFPDYCSNYHKFKI